MGKLSAYLQSIRPCGARTSRIRCGMLCVCLLGAGLATGAVIKLLDIYTQNLGNVFSQLSVWVFLCTLIAACSRSPVRAGVHVFLFAVGMLASYYLTAYLTESVYSGTMICGWTVFALLTPLFAFVAWYGKGSGVLAYLIALGIPTCMLLCAAILFDRVRLSDVLFAILTAGYLLYPARDVRKKGEDSK